MGTCAPMQIVESSVYRHCLENWLHIKMIIGIEGRGVDILTKELFLCWVVSGELAFFQLSLIECKGCPYGMTNHHFERMYLKNGDHIRFFV